jgi:hypothetical protein
MIAPDGLPVVIPEGRPNLPDATDMLDATSEKGSNHRLELELFAW